MMNIEEYFTKKTIIQENLLKLLDDERNDEEKYDDLCQILEDIKIRDNCHELRLFLRFISKISDNYHRNPTFFMKIDRILGLFKDEIKQYYSNTEIFNIFKKNKRILLFLLEEKIMFIDEYILKIMTSMKYKNEKYPQYFAPEIKSIVNEKYQNNNDFDKKLLVEWANKELPENFNVLRKEGENKNFICKLIRNDSVVDFIAYLNKNNISPNSKIKESKYETNYFLLKKQKDLSIKLIEYAAFFGSIQIFNYLKYQGVQLNPSLLLFAIHSKNSELIHIIEENNGNSNNFYLQSYIESIKCHHNEIANYLYNNYLQNEADISNKIFIQSLKSYNFGLLQTNLINELLFGQLCKFDYYSIVTYFLKINNDIINIKTIQ